MLAYLFSPFGRIGRISFLLGIFLWSIVFFILQAAVTHLLLNSLGLSDSLHVFQMHPNYAEVSTAQKLIDFSLIIPSTWIQFCLYCKRLRDIDWSIWLTIIPLGASGIILYAPQDQDILYGAYICLAVVFLILLFYPSEDEPLGD